MAHTQIIEFSQMTRLPVSEMAKSDGIGRALAVTTPHKGLVVIEYHEQGMFREKNKDMGNVLRQLKDLEWEAQDYLLSQWLNQSVT